MIAICTLCGGNRVHRHFLTSLLAEWKLHEEGAITFVSSAATDISRGRDQLTAIALANPDVTHILWIDSDEGWAPGLVGRLASHEKDIVGAAYRKKVQEVKWTHEVKEGGRREGDLLECTAAGTGALLVRREVYEKVGQRPDVQVKLDDLKVNGAPEDVEARVRENFRGYHLQMIYDGHVQSDDYAFCRRAVESGFDVWVDLAWPIFHWGEAMYAADAREFN